MSSDSQSCEAPRCWIGSLQDSLGLCHQRGVSHLCHVAVRLCRAYVCFFFCGAHICWGAQGECGLVVLLLLVLFSIKVGMEVESIKNKSDAPMGTVAKVVSLDTDMLPLRVEVRIFWIFLVVRSPTFSWTLGMEVELFGDFWYRSGQPTHAGHGRGTFESVGKSHPLQTSAT